MQVKNLQFSSKTLLGQEAQQSNMHNLHFAGQVNNENKSSPGRRIN